MKTLRAQSGSLLLEISLMVVVMGVLASFAIQGFGGMESSRVAMQHEVQLQLANKALKAFLMKEKRLPCPDLTGKGWEGDAAGSCPPEANTGSLPYVALNISKPQESLTLRYGVWRSTTAGDLVVPTSWTQGAKDVNSFLTVIGVAANSPAAQGQPFVAGRNAQGQSVDCATSTVVPAYALAFVTPGVVPPAVLCFSETTANYKNLSYITRNELLGWVSSTMR